MHDVFQPPQLEMISYRMENWYFLQVIMDSVSAYEHFYVSCLNALIHDSPCLFFWSIRCTLRLSTNIWHLGNLMYFFSLKNISVETWRLNVMFLNVLDQKLPFVILCKITAFSGKYPTFLRTRCAKVGEIFPHQWSKRNILWGCKITFPDFSRREMFFPGRNFHFGTCFYTPNKFQWFQKVTSKNKNNKKSSVCSFSCLSPFHIK